MRLKQLHTAWRTAGAFTLVETLVGAMVLGIVSLALFGAFLAGLGTVQSSRENSRATQILVQKMEALRLLTWSQGTNSVLAATNFVSYYDPSGTNDIQNKKDPSTANSLGTVYRGVYTPMASPTNIPTAYRDNLRLATITVYWTNYGRGHTPIVQRRQMQTFVARYGMQNYIAK